MKTDRIIWKLTAGNFVISLNFFKSALSSSDASVFGFSNKKLRGYQVQRSIIKSASSGLGVLLINLIITCFVIISDVGHLLFGLVDKNVIICSVVMFKFSYKSCRSVKRSP